MTFIETVDPDEATGAVTDLYESDRASFGYPRNTTRAFSLRPEVYAAWHQLCDAVKAPMDLRRYELATFAAAGRLKSSYCTLAHGSILADTFMEREAVTALVADRASAGAGLDEVDIAVMELADQVVGDATSVTQADVDRLRALGLSDAEILDIVLTAALGCFFSKVLDGVGALPDARFAELEPALRDALTVGRPIDEA
jgi:uncharacterized peroxidase-related enzyme